MRLISKKRVMGPNWKYETLCMLIAVWTLFMGIVNVHGIDIDRICPRMLHKVFNGYAPIGNFIYIHN